MGVHKRCAFVLDCWRYCGTDNTEERKNTCSDETDRDPVADNVNDMALMGGIDSLEKELINHINW